MLPLTGQSILVTRSATQANGLTQALIDQGATVWEMPTLEIVPPSSWQSLDQALQQLDQFDWLILTSSNGVDGVLGRLQGLGIPKTALSGLKIAVVGQKTALALNTYGYQPNFIPPQFIADSLVAHFPEPLSGLRILFPRVETGGREMLVQAMTAAGATVVEVPAYESQCPTQLDPKIAEVLSQQRLTLITFTSGKTVKHFCQLVGGSGRATQLLSSVTIASIGPQTSQACLDYLGHVDIEAQEHSLEGLVQAILAAQGS